MRFHLLGLAHLPCNVKYNACAFSMKIRKLAKMLTSLGHEVFYYGSEGADIESYCNSDKLHYIQTHTLEDIRKDYGTDNTYDIGYDHTQNEFRHDLNVDRKPSTIKYYKACIEHINKIKKPDDFLLITQGLYQKPIDEAVKLFLTCESGIGYRGSYCKFRAFESSFIMNFTYGSEHPYKSISGKHYDRVIPNYFDPEEIQFSDQKSDYYLFIGRLIFRKGLTVAVDVCNLLGKKLKIVGQGGKILEDGSLTCNNSPDFEPIKPGTWEYCGYADYDKRKDLMSHAKATFVPTLYLEPFAGTHVESMLCGTPVITTNFGVFPGTIPDNLNGKTGFRCDTLNDFVGAAKECERLKDYKSIHYYASRFLMDSVKYKYQKWFDDLYHVWKSTQGCENEGWYYVEKS